MFIVHELVSQNPSSAKCIDDLDEKHRLYPLILATMRNHVSTLFMLTTYGPNSMPLCNLDRVDANTGHTALQIALNSGFKDAHAILERATARIELFKSIQKDMLRAPPAEKREKHKRKRSHYVNSKLPQQNQNSISDDGYTDSSNTISRVDSTDEQMGNGKNLGGLFELLDEAERQLT